MINILFSRICVLTCGTLYPGYLSFKTVRAKLVDDYVKWIMYWIVFAIYTASESLTDIFLTWFPFYYELKVILLLWLLPTMGNGSSFLYKNCVHPLLMKHETRVDYHLEQFKEKGQDLVLYYMKEAVSYVSRQIMDVINKNLPNGILGFLANNNIYNTASSIPVPSNIIIEEVNNQDFEKKVVSEAKRLAKNSTGLIDSGETNTSRGRGRRTRKIKPETD